MRRTKIAISAILLFCLLFTFAACSSEPYEYDLSNYIKVPSLEGISVTDEQILREVDARILEILSNNTKYTESDENAIDSSSYVCISYVCHDESNAEVAIFEDNNRYFVMGNKKFPAEIENALIGTHKGANISVTINFPSDYALKVFSGKTVVFAIEVVSVARAEVPLYDEQFIREVCGFDSETAHREALYTQVKEDLIWEQVLELATVTSYPKEELDMYRLDFIDYYSGIALGEGLTLEEYVMRAFFKELSDFYVEAEDYAKQKVKEEMLVYSIVRENEIELSNSEYAELAQKYVERYGLANVSQLETKFGKTFVRYSILLDKVHQFLGEKFAVTPLNEENLA